MRNSLPLPGSEVTSMVPEELHITLEAALEKSDDLRATYENDGEIREMIEKKPEQVIRLAVRRMLPKTNLGRLMLRKLKVYAGTDHPHAAQQPQPLDV